LLFCISYAFNICQVDVPEKNNGDLMEKYMNMDYVKVFFNENEGKQNIMK